ALLKTFDAIRDRPLSHNSRFLIYVNVAQLRHARGDHALAAQAAASAAQIVPADPVPFRVAPVAVVGRVDGLAELFGGPDRSGFAELAALDTNGDGVITVGDAGFDWLRVWRDLDADGVSDARELFTLAQVGITSITAAGTVLDSATPQGVALTARGAFMRTDGTTGNAFDAVFATDGTDTIFGGENGIAPWAAALPDVKGFGRMANLAVVASNDFDVAGRIAAIAASMTTPNLAEIREKATPAYGLWAQALEDTRELAPVLLARAADGTVTLADRGVYVEDAAGGYWSLAAGGAVMVGGAAVARPTLEQILAQGVSEGQAWQLEQVFSPQTRAAMPSFRDAAPYLVEIVDDRPVIKDYGIRNADGTWHLASEERVAAATLSHRTIAEIATAPVAAGFAWRVEELGFNPFAQAIAQNLVHDRMGLLVVDGEVVDYSVQVTDADGAFHVWARNLDRALELQQKLGGGIHSRS
ncbi:MAG: hypothetical protein ABL908_20000, partial [Hyphomicrobium sp.]